jgi:hypothetical protein
VGGLENSFETEQDCRPHPGIPSRNKASKAAETHDDQFLSDDVDAAFSTDLWEKEIACNMKLILSPFCLYIFLLSPCTASATVTSGVKK